MWRLLLFLALAAAAGAQELPTGKDDEAGDVDPPILIQERKPDGSFVLSGAAQTAPDLDLEKLERDLARARRGAAGAEGLYRAGIISKVEAEERALRVVRLEAKLATARLELARQNAAADLASVKEAAERAVTERTRAELEVAARNVDRQKKLLALGSGRRGDLQRAEQKLAELQQPHE